MKGQRNIEPTPVPALTNPETAVALARPRAGVATAIIRPKQVPPVPAWKSIPKNTVREVTEVQNGVANRPENIKRQLNVSINP